MSEGSSNRNSILLASALAILVMVVGASFLLRAPDPSEDKEATPAAAAATPAPADTVRMPGRPRPGLMMSPRQLRGAMIQFPDGGAEPGSQ